ncbi:hypothetical protein PIB30_019938 [Stylosanthes scabra]|uniref:Uncharacterized protein n=1 Tax=Stylosanthes scabra TaxID=79078 RepID=A0ABU6W9L8_9FABA|nr:hypothetical protein [Stylosanthes scabra]
MGWRFSFRAEFGAEVVDKSKRNEKIATKPRRPFAGAYAYEWDEAMCMHYSLGGTPKCYFRHLCVSTRSCTYA